jgi:hypothetical protein
LGFCIFKSEVGSRKRLKVFSSLFPQNPTIIDGCLDILVNNVGMRDRRGLFEFEMDAVRRLINTLSIGFGEHPSLADIPVIGRM